MRLFAVGHRTIVGDRKRTSIFFVIVIAPKNVGVLIEPRSLEFQ